MREFRAPHNAPEAVAAIKRDAIPGPMLGAVTTERRPFILEKTTDTASERSMNSYNQKYDQFDNKDEDDSWGQNDATSRLMPIGLTTKLGIGIAIFLQLVTIIVLLFITFRPVYIRTFGLLDIEKRTLYVVGTTLAVSAISGYTVGQIRQLWMENELLRPGGIGRTRCARVILGTSTFAEKAKHLPVVMSFLVTGLITSAVVAAFVPNVVTTLRNVQATWIPSDDGIVCMETTNNSTGLEFEWRLPNGSYYSLNTSRNDNCASQKTEYAVSALLDQYVDLYAYTINGVFVDRGAIGTPYTNTFGGFHRTFGVEAAVEDGTALWSLFQWATACLPVFVQNPWTCRAAGDVIVGKNELTVMADGCNITRPIFGVDMKTQGATAAGACTQGQSIGQATIVIGAVNDHAAKLRNTLASYQNIRSLPSYSVACTVDVEPALGFRLVNFSRSEANPDGQLNPHFSTFQLTGGSECTPVSANRKTIHNVSELFTRTQLAQAASAPWQLLTENAYNNGWWSQLWLILSQKLRFEGGPPLTVFNNSANALEDSFGLVSSIMAGYDLGFAGLEPEEFSLSDGTVAVTATRIGAGSLWSLFYIVPELFALSLILNLLWARRVLDRSSGSGFPEAGRR